MNNSAFFHFGFLPEVCIHSLIKDEYSPMYTPREFCDCGSNEWVISYMKMTADDSPIQLPLKDVQCCKICNEVRMADHIGSETDREPSC